MPIPQENRGSQIDGGPDISLAQEHFPIQSSHDLTFKVDIAEKNNRYTLLQVGFGAESTNDQKVIDARDQVEKIIPQLFGKPVFVNGQISTNVAVTLGHELHLVPAVGFFEPATSSYVIALATGGKYRVGQKIPADAEGRPLLDEASSASSDVLTPRSGDQRTFVVEIEEQTEAYTKIKMGFGAASGNDQKVVDAQAQANSIKEGESIFGKPLFLNGRVSTQVAALLGAQFAHVVPAIGTFEPATASYVISVAHGSDYRVGQTIPADDKGTPLLQ
jgi:hypothetical protein